MSDPLSAFMPAVRAWFTETFRQPTPPQALGWPPIQRGEHTLILSPTGSGKTLAAFLWGINALYEKMAAGEEPEGVELLYVSPLKALNNDIERNLRAPLAGIRRVAKEMGTPLPPLRVAVRTGDTPASARMRMVRQPPHILITTPESLYLILTSPQARGMLRQVRTLIVDEIHTLCGNKRGVHLSLSVELLAHLASHPIQRIGLSATQRPLEEVARFLGGQEWVTSADGERRLEPRPVTIVDAGLIKPLDLQVITVARDFRDLPGGSLWAAAIPRVLDLIRRHRTTLIFANSRRQAERTADRLNEQYAVEEREELPPGTTEALAPGGVPKGAGFFGTGAVGGPFRAHHGSISKTARLEMEHALKEGRLPALVGTSSLELGIDIGSVDLVVQLQSPKGVARGLQRIGRSGHLVGQTSVGRIFATHREDLVEAAAVTRAMLDGDVEPTYTPQNCLDVLAQQIVAAVSVQDWEANELYDVVRQSYAYQKLTPDLYHSVLDMLSGKYPSTVARELRPRIAWDRVHNRLAALPGSRLLAIRNGGTIPDRGAFGAYLPDGKTKIGELDEEFVYETRPGDVFTLGANTWRVIEITQDRVIVADATGAMPRMPFWRGDLPRRDYHLGMLVGRFRRELAERVRDLPPLPDDPEAPWPEEAQAILDFLQQQYKLDENSGYTLLRYVKHQLDVLGAISSDQTIIVETFTDALGDLRMVIHSCFGARVNSPWALSLAHALRERTGRDVEVQVNDDGILFRFLDADGEPPVNLVREMGPKEVRERLLAELPNSALFGAQFRMNAARALLLPTAGGRRKRTPFWLQRLRAKDLLAVTKGFPDFPIIAETYRDVLRDVLDLAHLEEVLGKIQSGDIRVVTAETIVPSPVAQGLLFDFTAVYMYEWDMPKAERQMATLSLSREMLAQLLDEAALPDLLKPEAVQIVDRQLQRIEEGYRARTPDELAILLYEAGDLTTEEIAARCSEDARTWLEGLADSHRALQVEIATPDGPCRRWIASERYALYRDAFGLPPIPPVPLPADLLRPQHPLEEACWTILRRYLQNHGPLTRAEIQGRYGFPGEWLDEALKAMVEAGDVVSGRLTPGATEVQWCDRRNLERIHRQTLTLLRKEIQPVSLFAYADFLTRWQKCHPAERLSGMGGLTSILQQLRGAPAPGLVWERDLLRYRLWDFNPADLEELCQRGEVVWVGSGGKDPRRGRIRFLFRGEGAYFLQPEPDPEAIAELSDHARAVWDFLKAEGACFTTDLQAGLGLKAETLSKALVELVMAGIVTNDTLTAMREVLAHGSAGEAGERRPLSSLEEELAEWRARREPRPLTRERYYAAKRAAARRTQVVPRWSGRWSLVHRLGVWGKDASPEERVWRQARQLLARYGIVTRESLANEEGSWDWTALYPQFLLMEMRGEVRRGYFVRGLPGVQFALPEAVERLRQWNAPEAGGSEELVLLNATDPANPFGPALAETGAALPPERNPMRFARLPSTYLVLRRGQPILLLENAERVTTMPGIEEAVIGRAMRLCIEHLTAPGGLASRPRRITLTMWDGQPVLDSSAATLLESLGFRREALAMVWEEI